MMILLILSLVSAMADGDAAMSKGDYETATQHYRAEAAMNPESYDAKFKLARSLSYSNHRTEALQVFTELLTTRPSNSDLLLARGRTYAWDDRWAEAEADLTAVVTRIPDYGDAWSALGDMYLWSDRPGKAVDAYGKWIAVEPDNPRAYSARAKAHRSAGNIDAARADFEFARAYGTPAPEVDRYLATLQVRRAESEAEVPAGYTWLAGLSYDRSRFSTNRSDWHYYSATIRRYWKQVSLGFEYLSARRFDSDDHALALDGYVDLWPRSYANVRYQYSPRAILYPDDSYRIEIFQGMGKGWELSGSYDHMNFGDSNVDMYGVSLGKYTGNWYLRWRILLVPSPTGTGTSHRALARYYYSGNGDDYLEISGGFGRGGEFLWGSTTVAPTRSRSIGAAYQVYLASRWGVRVSLGRSDNEGQDPIIEQDISLKVLARW